MTSGEWPTPEQVRQFLAMAEGGDWAVRQAAIQQQINTACESAWNQYLDIIEARLRNKLVNVEHKWVPVMCEDRELCGDPHVLYYQCSACKLKDHGNGGYGRWSPGLTGIWFDDCPASEEPPRHIRPLDYHEMFKVTFR